jgi:hypothetical protein
MAAELLRSFVRSGMITRYAPKIDHPVRLPRNSPGNNGRHSNTMPFNSVFTVPGETGRCDNRFITICALGLRCGRLSPRKGLKGKSRPALISF